MFPFVRGTYLPPTCLSQFCPFFLYKTPGLLSRIYVPELEYTSLLVRPLFGPSVYLFLSGSKPNHSLPSGLPLESLTGSLVVSGDNRSDEPVSEGNSVTSGFFFSTVFTPKYSDLNVSGSKSVISLDSKYEYSSPNFSSFVEYSL